MLHRNSYPILLGALLLSLLIIGCKSTPKKIVIKPFSPLLNKVQQKSIKGNFSDQKTIKLDSNNIKLFLASYPGFKEYSSEMEKFYTDRNYAYAWYDKKGMIEPAINLFNRIMNIKEEGISNELPYKEAFINLIDSANEMNKVSPTVELMLTAQYLTYAKKVWEGVNEKQSLSVEWLLPRKKISSRQLLDSLLNGNNILENAPVYRQYNLLKAYLKKYNDIKINNDFTVIKADKKEYKLKDSAAVILAIRTRLFLLGDLSENNKTAIFDNELMIGVMRLAHRLGYKEDGIINTALLTEINYPINKRIEQIIVNMERTRWVPIQLTGDYLVVNIPEYKLHVYAKDSLAFSMNVVVGKNEHKTVIFNGDMNYIVFSPYWNIPASILNKEILPGIKKNPNYLAEHNMEWNGNSIRQKPGPNNSLGLVKFLFPNSHSIYLHDSPAKSLFKENNRAFSHGCIRLAEPKKLAQYLLKNNPDWNSSKITAAMNNKIEQYVKLKPAIPVFIAYFTVWVDRQGLLNFRKDVYQRDSRLAQMIIEKPGI